MPLEPFSDASFSQVLARVAYRLIELDYRHNKAAYQKPVTGLYRLSKQTYAEGFTALAFWVHAYLMGVRAGDRLVEVRRLMIQRSRAGCSWRRVAYNPYKGTRRDDPRVTNRGVTGRDLEEGQQ